MATIMCLPDEMIEIILSYSDITINDVISFKCVCKRFCGLVTNRIMKKKYLQRWSFVKTFYDTQSKKNENEFEENKGKNQKIVNFIETGVNCLRELKNYISQIIHNYNYDSLNNTREFDEIFCKNKIDEIIYKPENIIKYYFFIDELKKFYTQFSRRIDCDLTEIYINKELFRYMKLCFVREMLKKFKEKPRRKQLIEEDVAIAIQCMQLEKYIFYECVKSSLDSIAEEVLNCLREEYPNHSIFSTSAETFSYWKNNNIYDNHWDEAESTQIMDTLEEYIFGKLNFRLCQETDRNVENFCIDNVLKNKCGQKIILLIIYESVARRLGLRCVVIRKSMFIIDEYYMFWMPKYATRRFENARCYDITFEEFPKRLHKQLLPFLMNRENTLEDFIPKPEEMLFLLVQRFLGNVDRIHEIYVFFNLRGIEYGISKFYQWHLRNEWLKKKKSYRSPKEVKFTVGMIVKHGKEVGVIVGFDIDRSDTIPLDDTISLDDTQNLLLDNILNMKQHVMLLYQFFGKLRQQQIYYTILTEDNRLFQAEEGTITLTTPKWINNNEIGRYFCKFEGTHYVPNKMLAKIYPYNAATRAEIEIAETLFDL